MTTSTLTTAKAILAAEGGHVSAEDVARSGSQACEKLLEHLARLVGRGGAQALIARSIGVTQVKHGWLRADDHSVGDRPWASERLWAGLHHALVQQAPATAIDAFATWLSNLMDLLTRLIGAALVARLVHEIWPTVFPRPAKEST